MSNLDQMPPLSLNVAMPDSAESPAPVRTTMLRYVGIARLLL
jgi:hypothetical protein